jgi:PrgI family protein
MTAPVKIPSDVDRPDRLLGPLTGRQLIICGGGFVLLYLLWLATRAVIAPLVYAVFAVPAAGAAIALALARRDAVSLDQYALAGLRHRAATRSGLRELRDPGVPGEIGGLSGTGDTRVASWVSARASTRRALAGRVPTNPPRAPARNITRTGVINTHDGHAVVAVASPVNFALRSPEEQQAVTATFAGWLHSLNAPVQILIRALPVDLTGQITSLRHVAGDLAHPALTAAAHDHATYLAHLAEHYELLRHQVLIIFHEPAHTTAIPAHLGQAGGQRDGSTAGSKAAETRLAHRLGEATELLNPAGITLTPLRADQATAVLAAATHPDRLTPSHAMARPGAVITHARRATPHPHTPPAEFAANEPATSASPGGSSGWPEPRGDTTGAASGWDSHDELDPLDTDDPTFDTDDPTFDPDFEPGVEAGLDAYAVGEQADGPAEYPVERGDRYSDRGGEGFGGGLGDGFDDRFGEDGESGFGAGGVGELSDDRPDGAGQLDADLEIGLDTDIAYGGGAERDRPRPLPHQVTKFAASDDTASEDTASITWPPPPRRRSRRPATWVSADADLADDADIEADVDTDAGGALERDNGDHASAPARLRPRRAGPASVPGQWGWSR